MPVAAVNQVGRQLVPKEFGPITRTDIVRYQGASGDFVALHHDEPFAISAGFPTVFSVGMLQAGILATYVTDELGLEGLRRYSLRFREQCWPGDILTCGGEVTAVDEGQSGSLRVIVSLSCARQTGGIAVSATAEFELCPPSS